MAGGKIHFTSLGCARNLVDSEVMLGILLRAGFEATDRVGDADYLVINTCGFLADSRRESCDTITSVFHDKKKAAKVIVTGCMVQNRAEEIRRRFPEVHYLLGSGDVEKIMDAIRAREAGDAVTAARSYLEWGEVPRRVSTPGHYAYLKIAEGCAKKCAFCIIPNIKGPLRSKSEEQVLKEFNALLDQGVFEVILIAQDLGDYGRERKERDGLLKLLRRMLGVKKDFWLRLLYLYPDEITDDLIGLMKSDPRICPYLDMPIQHIHDAMLRAMRRTTDRAHIVRTLTTLRERIPGVVVRTSLMVGFPGETEDQFEEMVDFIQAHPLDNIGIFKFSREEEAHAATLPDQIGEDVKQKRFERLAKTQMSMVRKRNRAYIGKRLRVLIDGHHPESRRLFCGRFYGQCPEVDGHVIINDARKDVAFGKLHDVEITDAADYDLIGRVV